MSGHLLPCVTMTPFSVLKVSAGSPWMFQSRTLEGSARKPLNSKPSLDGMFSSFTYGRLAAHHSVRQPAGWQPAKTPTLTAPRQLTCIAHVLNMHQQSPQLSAD
jgi:hypothetical protein